MFNLAKGFYPYQLITKEILDQLPDYDAEIDYLPLLFPLPKPYCDWFKRKEEAIPLDEHDKEFPPYIQQSHALMLLLYLREVCHQD